MAERGAHLTATTQIKPSIFEVIAQDSLATTIHPALKRVAEFLASCNPEKFGWLLKWFEEMYLGLNVILQHHYLKYYGSSFAETFYSLQRFSIEKPSQLSRRARLLSFLCLSLLPYLHHRMNQLVARLRLDEADGVPPGPVWTRKSRHLTIRLYSGMSAAWEVAVLAQYLRYMSGHSPSHSPLLGLLGIGLQYAPEEQGGDVDWRGLWDSAATPATRFHVLSLKLFGRSLIRMLEVGVFFLQFLQWWQAEQLQTGLTTLPVPTPPKVSVEGQRCNSKCPICLEPWKIETVLPVSGFVFCYRCIVHHLQRTGMCPVTKLPATIQDLVRLYK